MSDISEKTKQHLTQVYTMLLAMTVVAAFGMYVNSAIIVRGFFLTILSVLLSVYLMF